jgi:DnaJ-class molecular chaperone
MMSIIHKCPHCGRELPGWSPQPNQQYTGTWGDNHHRQWQLCPACNGAGVFWSHGATGPVPCVVCHGQKWILATP